VLFDAPAALADAFDGRGGVGMIERPYGALIQRASDAHGVNLSLIPAMIEVESAYDPRARSQKGRWA
jgi:soluble lytic murein transglycosylase-like protein